MKKNLLGISLITMTCLYGLLAAIIILIFILTGLPVINGIIISIIILIIQFLISPFLTDLSMKWFYKARFENDIPEYLRNFINQICDKYNMKYPKIGLIDDGAPNAFTYGRTKNDARIVLTRGIFNLLNEQEVMAVVGHELGHAKHYDMVFMTVAQLVPLVLYGIYETFTRSNSKSSSNNNSSGYLEMIGLIAYILYVLSEYIVLWLSRTREYYADSFSIEETRNPNALTTSLIKIGYGLSINNEPKQEDEKKKKKHTISNSKVIGIFDSKTSKALVSTSYNNGLISADNIKNAMKWETWNIWAKLYELKSTHPLISKRLKAISNRCNEYGQTPFVTFDLTKTESYVDDFAIEVVINYLPIVTLLLTLIIATISGIYTDYGLKIVGIGGIITMILSFIKLGRRYKNNIEYKETTVSNLLGEVKVSGVTSIPCALEGTIIGRGNPGCIFNEDFVIKDNTGIMFLDYNQPLKTVNKIFAIFKSKEYFDKTIKVKGWYRRSPVPYIEIKEMEIDGKIKKCYTYTWAKISRIILLIVFALLICLF